METPHHSLPEGTLIGDRFEVRSVLGVGGFGITYKGWDRHLACEVAIKEYLPEFASRAQGDLSVRAHGARSDDYRYGLQRFLDEARTLARFRHPNVVRVVNFLESNGTAYLVMDYEEGESLGQYLKRTGAPLSEKQVRAIAEPILKGLVVVHAGGFLHRDIKPGNIYLRREGEPLLIDFGAARQALGEHSRSVTGIVSAGYAPPEQYSTDAKKQGPWTDLYGLGATLYRCISGADPVDSPTRREAVHDGEADPLVPAREIGKGRYAAALLALIDRLLLLTARERPQSAEEALAVLGAETSAYSAPPSPAAPATADTRFPSAAAPQAPEAPKLSAAAHSAWPRWVAGIAALAAVVVLAVGVSLGWFARDDATNPSPAAVRQEQELAAAREREAQARAAAEPEGQRLLAALGIAMVDIPAGSFAMGSTDGEADERPVHAVTVKPFRLSATEVTVAQFGRFVEATGYSTEAERNVGAQGCFAWSEADGKGDWRPGTSWRNPGFSQGGTHPVVCVSWNDAQAFVRWLGEKTTRSFRLPSEAEWEYAARAGSVGTLYGFGNNPSDLCRYGNVADQSSSPSGRTWTTKAECNDGFFLTAPVGNYRANAWGLYDMHGNVWEWAEDCYSASYAGAPADGRAWSTGGCESRVSRGGGWGNYPARVRSAFRNRNTPTDRTNNMGFRLAEDRP